MRRPPYAPFLSGAPDFVVGLRPIDAATWLQPDIEAARLQDKCALIAARRDEVFRALAGSLPAQREAARLVGAACAMAPAPDDPAPLLSAAHWVSDDLIVMAPDPEGFRASALVLCAPTFFSAEDAIGKTLFGLHAPVPDRLGPDQSQGLGGRIGRVFQMLRAGAVLERFNWTVQAGGEAYTPNGAPLRARAEAAEEREALDLLHLRVERQTIRALPESGAVLFTIRVSLDPLRAVFAQDGWREAFAAAWAGAPAHVRAYKKWAAYERPVAAALRLAQQQR